MKVKITKGDVFAFKIENKNQYGIIQAINKTKLGVDVRVFSNTIDDLSNNQIMLLLESEEYYYIRNFYEYELLNKSEVYLGNFKLDLSIEMPRYMRISERKLNDKIVWSIIDTKKDDIVKVYKGFDEELRSLSPANIWGIDYIYKRWKENFKLKLWDDILEDKWYREYLTKYEPDKLIINENHHSILQIDKPTKLWRQRIGTKENIVHLTDLIIDEIDGILNKFIKTINNNNFEESKKALETMIIELNDINDKYSCIETEESEELIEYLGQILKNTMLYQIADEYINMRSW